MKFLLVSHTIDFIFININEDFASNKLFFLKKNYIEYNYSYHGSALCLQFRNYRPLSVLKMRSDLRTGSV